MALLFIRFLPQLVYTNHIDNEKHMHHGFLAPQAYLGSTSLINQVIFYRIGMDGGMIYGQLELKNTTHLFRDFGDILNEY